MNMSLLDETVSHLSHQNIDSDEDLDEDEYCSETIADLFSYSDSDEEFHGYVNDGWEIVTSSSSSESPSGSDSDDENVGKKVIKILVVSYLTSKKLLA